jgi:hypothetical protein
VRLSSPRITKKKHDSTEGKSLFRISSPQIIKKGMMVRKKKSLFLALIIVAKLMRVLSSENFASINGVLLLLCDMIVRKPIAHSWSGKGH